MTVNASLPVVRRIASLRLYFPFQLLRMQYKIQVIAFGLLFFSCTLSHAQRFPEPGSIPYKRLNRHGTFALTAGVGVSSYFGDLKGHKTDLWVKPSSQLGFQYKVNNHFLLRTEVMWYRIAGADSLNDEKSSIYSRNLSFRSDNLELNLVALFHWFNKHAHSKTALLNPYGFAGLGVTSIDPLALYQGEWHSLRPLMTEGKRYSAATLVIPFGIGIACPVNNSFDVSFEYGYRYSFSDYLDDVSSVHIGVENMADPIRRALSDRRPERGLDPARAGGQRGNENINDWYLIVGLKAVYTPSINYRKPRFR
jgi:hypothetical protein